MIVARRVRSALLLRVRVVAVDSFHKSAKHGCHSPIVLGRAFNVGALPLFFSDGREFLIQVAATKATFVGVRAAAMMMMSIILRRKCMIVVKIAGRVAHVTATVGVWIVVVDVVLLLFLDEQVLLVAGDHDNRIALDGAQLLA